MTSALILIGCLLLGAHDDQSAVKEKQNVVVIKDKSKPVRRALEIQYARLAEAVENRDFEAFQALRFSGGANRFGHGSLLRTGPPDQVDQPRDRPAARSTSRWRPVSAIQPAGATGSGWRWQWGLDGGQWSAIGVRSAFVLVAGRTR